MPSIPPFFNSVLLIPTYDNARVLNSTLAYFDKLDPQPKYYIFLENNSSDDTLNLLYYWKSNHPNTEIIRLWFKKDAVTSPYEIIGLVRQMLLDRARKLGVDFAIFIDDDIFLAEKDFITKITRHGKDLVGGAYFRSYPQGDFLSYLAFGKVGYVLRSYQKFRLQEIAAISGGCMCIGKKLLMDKRINFSPILNNYSEDFGYCARAMSYGYKIYIDDSFKICHYQIHEARAWRKGVKFEY